ncbi:MAG: DUF1049 domain-containing protein [Candidatus Aegiribacteria sp.]|nr:DUF1049 domain-containing protein [Candidatus Aegiribacteria sp.]
MKPKMIAILILATLLLVIVVQNSNAVDLHLLLWKISMSMIILIFFVSLIGFVIGYLAHHFVTERKKNK